MTAVHVGPQPQYFSEEEIARIVDRIDNAKDLHGLARAVIEPIVRKAVEFIAASMVAEILKTGFSPGGEIPTGMPKPLSISGPRDSISPNYEGSSGLAAATQSSQGVKGI